MDKTNRIRLAITAGEIASVVGMIADVLRLTEIFEKAVQLGLSYDNLPRTRPTSQAAVS